MNDFPKLLQTKIYGLISCQCKPARIFQDLCQALLLVCMYQSYVIGFSIIHQQDAYILHNVVVVEAPHILNRYEKNKTEMMNYLLFFKMYQQITGRNIFIDFRNES